MTTTSIDRRLCRMEDRLRHRFCGPHRYTDDELDDLIAWLKDPQPDREEWAASLLRREGLIR